MSTWEFIKEIIAELFRWSWDDDRGRGRYQPVEVEVKD